ncbi:MAG: esterase/lipase family protein [Anaerolineales bacterium]
MAQDILQTFQSADIEQQAQLAAQPQYAEALKAYLGEAAFADYESLAADIRAHSAQQHLGLSAPKNLLFVPGIMGSMLSSRTLGGLWWIDVLRGADKLNKLGLDPSGHDDADPTYQIYPSGIDTAYAPFQRAALLREDFGHDTFPYDWRKPLTHSTGLMRQKILEMHANNGNVPVNIVAHSMGGLMTRATLAEHGDELWPLLNRIVFIGTPHYGAPLAACKLKFHLWGLTTQDILFALLIKPEVFRSLWGAVSLIPAPIGVYPGTRSPGAQHPGLNFDHYNAEAWNLKLSVPAAHQWQRILDYVAQFHRTLHDYHIGLDQSYRDRMAVIAGVGFATGFRLEMGGGLLGGDKRDNARTAGEPHRESDGTVTLASAELENVGATRYAKVLHAELPNHPEVYADVFRWLKGESLKLPTATADALSQHLAGNDTEFPALTEAARRHADSEAALPAEITPDPQLVAELQAQIAAGQLPPELNLARPL